MYGCKAANSRLEQLRAIYKQRAAQQTAKPVSPGESSQPSTASPPTLQTGSSSQATPPRATMEPAEKNRTPPRSVSLSLSERMFGCSGEKGAELIATQMQKRVGDVFDHEASPRRKLFEDDYSQDAQPQWEVASFPPPEPNTPEPSPAPSTARTPKPFQYPSPSPSPPKHADVPDVEDCSLHAPVHLLCCVLARKCGPKDLDDHDLKSLLESMKPKESC